MEYYRIYMQKEQDGSPLVETIEAFGMYCMTMPYLLGGKLKELTSRTWADADGKDVYVPKVLKEESGELKIKFGYKGQRSSANKQVKAFINYLKGQDGNGVYMNLYCTYTEQGWHHVRLTDISDEATLVRGSDGDLLIMQITLTVDEPTQSVTVKRDTNGEITRLY